jgi:hypothetical protein
MTEPSALDALHERLVQMRDDLLAGLARETYLDSGKLQLLGTVGSALRALEDARDRDEPPK